MDTYYMTSLGEVQRALGMLGIPLHVRSQAQKFFEFASIIAKPDHDGDYDLELCISGPSDTGTKGKGDLYKIEIGIVLEPEHEMPAVIRFVNLFTRDSWIAERSAQVLGINDVPATK